MVERETGFWQWVVIEDIPSYCSSYWRSGHSYEECKKASSEILSRNQEHQHRRLQRDSRFEGHIGQVAAPVRNLAAIGDKNKEARVDVTASGNEAQEAAGEGSILDTPLTGSDASGARPAPEVKGGTYVGSVVQEGSMTADPSSVAGAALAVVREGIVTETDLSSSAGVVPAAVRKGAMIETDPSRCSGVA